jgi:hypothetical protein
LRFPEVSRSLSKSLEVSRSLSKSPEVSRSPPIKSQVIRYFATRKSTETLYSMCGISIQNIQHTIGSKVREHRKNNTLLYTIHDIDISSFGSYRDCIACIEKHIPSAGTKLPQLFHLHYRRYHPLFWRYWLDTWLPICTNILILYTSPTIMPELYTDCTHSAPTDSLTQSPFVCAIMMYIRRPDIHQVYARVLCSSCHCGSKLIRHLQDTYAHSSEYMYITFHSDPSTIKLYKKHHCIETSKYIKDILGTKYTFMYYPTHGDNTCTPVMCNDIITRTKRSDTPYIYITMCCMFCMWWFLLII